MNKTILKAKPQRKKILLIKIGAVGDLIMASSFFESVREHFPNAHISHLVSRQIFHTVKENPHIDRFILADSDKIYKGSWFARLQETIRLIFLLRRERFDMVFVLHWAWPYNLLAFLCGIPVRVGFNRNREGLFLTHRVNNEKDRNNREAYLDLIRILGKRVQYRKSHYYLSENEDRFLETFVQENHIGPGDHLIALAPGGGKNIKQTMLTRLWPVDRYLGLLDRLFKEGPYRIVLIAGREDGPVIQPILERFPECIDTRNLSFGEKASILRRCRLLVGNDSAPIHMAMAMAVPTFSLWGPTNPKRYGDPLSLHVPIFKKIECSPCYADGEYPDCRDNRCMQAITVEEVWKTLRTTLDVKTDLPAAIDIFGSRKELPLTAPSAQKVVLESPNPPNS